jgi:hypothetical protein
MLKEFEFSFKLKNSWIMSVLMILIISNFKFSSLTERIFGMIKNVF